MCRAARGPTSRSNPLDEGVDHPLLARLVELHGELVAVDFGHFAVAEFRVEYALTQREGRAGCRAASDDLAVNGDRPALEAALALVGKAFAAIVAPLRATALPARRAIGRGERLEPVEAARWLPPAALRLGDLDARLRQFVEKPARHGRVPQTVNAPVRSEIELGTMARAGEPDMGKPPLLFEPGAALLVKRALVGQQPLLPARQNYGIEFEAFRRMQRHQ